MKLQNVSGFDVLEFSNEITWEEAMKLPEKANLQFVGEFTDWVLPDVQTLRALSLLKHDDGRFWSSSPPYTLIQRNAFCVSFSDGRVLGVDIKHHNKVKLVRFRQCLDINVAGSKLAMQEVGIALPEVTPTPKKAEFGAFQADEGYHFLYFTNFKDAKSWAKRNPGAIIIKNPNGPGFIEKK